MKNRIATMAATVGLTMGIAGVANAYLVTASSGTRSASADFQVSGNNLIVTLTNTSSSDVLVPIDVLTALFFSVSGDPSLARVSAVLNTGSLVFYDPDGQPAGGVVGGEWAYVDSLSGAPLGADEGISSSGLGLFGPGDRFPGLDLQSPTSPDGLQYGLLSAGDNIASGNTGVTGTGGLILNSVVFTLSGLPGGFTPDATSITNVSFQYGTALDEPNIPSNGGGSASIPEPSSGALALVAVGALAATFRYRRRQQQ